MSLEPQAACWLALVDRHSLDQLPMSLPEASTSAVRNSLPLLCFVAAS
jgi:hypothetical protein